ncbi:MFS transporter [Nonomuraea sp. NPDC005650]|uniref:MFS transporter n=1 Tax=Nonomuraea sp. NPDC005650 TaxID=3157045 RepID=UPI0033BCB596
MQPNPAGGTVERSAARPNAILAIILISYFMILLDNSVIFTGLPSIRADLDLSPGVLSWVQDAYTLVFGGLLLLGARAGDLLGRRRLFVAGLSIFGVASLLIGLAPTGWWIVAARALQGIGAAIVAPTSLALITAHFNGRERARAVAWYGATAGIGASLGLLVGGALAAWISWRAAFLVNVPIAVAMIVAARRVLAETGRSRGRFDALGAGYATLGMGALVFGIVSAAEYGWAAPVALAGLAAGVLLLTALVFHESRAEQPIMPLRLFRDRERSGAYAARMLYMGAMIGFFYFTTQYLQDVLGFDPLQAGLGFLPMTAVNFAVAMAIPRLSDRLPRAALLTAGVAATAAGMAWLSRLDAGDTYLTAVALPMLLIGAGQGLAFAPLTSAGIARIGSADAGAASGLVNTAHQLGMALGLGILVAASTRTAAPGSAPGGAGGVAAHVSAALTGSTVLLALALLVVMLVIAPARQTPSTVPATPINDSKREEATA